jgi:CRISPR-associated protein Cmr1
MNTPATTAPQPATEPRMRVLRLQVRFLTPAFLGDAEQNGRWRTPPFKAQLRQWWRVAYAADHGFDVNVEHMRREEGLLFGNAWLENDFRKSLVRLRLQHWRHGSLKAAQWPADAAVTHPEVKNRDGKNVPVGSALYLGYGPLIYDNQRRATGLKANAAIQAGEAVELAAAFPMSDGDETLKLLVEENAPRIERALWLMDRYGAVGGRSRNGWGSYALESAEPLTGAVPLRDWPQCLDLDWPHAIGRDEKGPLIWVTEPHVDWKALMKTLAVIKIGLRTQFRFTSGSGAAAPESRHWLSYPVTKHDVRSWGQLRLPNQLRFKVRQAADGKLVGVIFHMPHLPPSAFQPDRAVIKEVWRCVHQFLDALTEPAARRRYCASADRSALDRQRAQLDSVVLKRSSV